jgi:hypothetical protein
MAPESVWPVTRGDGVVVAILDSGVSGAAPALSGAVLPGIDVVGGGAADQDCRGTGTALAGVIAAHPATGSGVVGLAPAARILPVRVIDGEGRVPPDAIAKGIKAVAAVADVVLVGTGTTVSTPELVQAVAEAVANDALVVA